MPPPIIERADLQNRSQRWGSALFTAVFWLLWLYLWLPTILQLHHALQLPIGSSTAVWDILQPLVLLMASAACCGSPLIFWALYNQIDYRQRRLRQNTPPVDIQTAAEFYQLESESLRQSQTAQRLVIQHDEQGQIIAVQSMQLENRTLSFPSRKQVVAEKPAAEADLPLVKCG